MGFCALDKGDSKAADYFSEVAKIAHELGHWENYLISERRAISTMALMEIDLEKGLKEDAVSEFEDLWGDALQMMKPAASYFGAAAYVFGDYLVTLALMGRRGDVEKLLKEHGQLLNVDERLSVATCLVLKYLGVNVKAPSSEEVLEAIEE